MRVENRKKGGMGTASEESSKQRREKEKSKTKYCVKKKKKKKKDKLKQIKIINIIKKTRLFRVSLFGIKKKKSLLKNVLLLE